MNKRVVISILLGVLAVGVVVMLVVENLTTKPIPEAEEPVVATTKESKPREVTTEHRLWALPAARTATKETPEPPDLVDIKDEQGAVTGQGVRLRPGIVLATVNQIPLTLADLVPVTRGQGEVVMDVAEYELRMAKAVEAELTMQAARSQGVGLDLAQQERVAKIAQRHAEDVAKYKEQGANWSSVTPEQLAYEEQQMAVNILQQNLVKKVAGVGPSADPAEQAKYEEALRALMGRLKGNASVVMYSSLASTEP
jgi:hypothetical protein